MQVGMPEVFLGLAVAIYIFMLLDRVCKCVENCSRNNMMKIVYANMDPVILQQTLASSKEK